MRYCRMLLALVLLFGLVAVSSRAPRPDASVSSVQLLDVMALSPAETVHKVWVHFQARDLEGPELTAALNRAQAQLNPRAARRRAKMHADQMPNAGAYLVDVRDLPLAPDRLRACRDTGARLHQQSRWLNAASFRATASQVARLTRVPGVRRVELVRGLRRAAVPTPVGRITRWGSGPRDAAIKTTDLDYGTNQAAMVQANVAPVHDMGLSGKGVLVGMLDTGFRTTHEALSGIPVLAAWDFVNNDGVVDQEVGDPNGAVNHGTMTLSTVAGNRAGHLIAPAYAASVVLAKTEDIAQEVPLEEDNWVAGLEWAEALGAEIISSSLGYYDWYGFSDLDGNTAVTTIAADLAAARGLVVVTSAGNNRGSTGYLIAPGDADSVVTVGAVDTLGVTASFSSPGPTTDGRIKPDVAALGVRNTVASPSNDTEYLAASGTSFSCPLTSGVVALMLERVPGLTPLQVLEALRKTASQSTNPDNDQGWGIIDAAAAVTWFGPVITHTPLAPTNDPVGPYTLTALITDRLGLATGSLRLRYRVSGGPWQEVPLAANGQPDGFQAQIPGQPLQTAVEYYLTASSSNGLATSYPFAGANDPLTLFVVANSPVGDNRLPIVTQLGPNVPNPFNPQTEIPFALERSGPVVLRIYDPRGQLVRTLLDGDLAQGPHTVRWDGRDRAGRAVSSGTYFYRLTSAGQAQQRKMQLVR